jgi:hypothetical protein
MTWRERLLDDRLQEAPLDGAMAVRAADLHGAPGDPIDRFILATAMVHGASLVTADDVLLRWSHALTRVGVSLLPRVSPRRSAARRASTRAGCDGTRVPSAGNTSAPRGEQPACVKSLNSKELHRMARFLLGTRANPASHEQERMRCRQHFQ